MPRRSYLLRRWLATEEGEAPSAVQAACWLDVKRAYLEGRPTLRRVFLTVRDLAPYAPAAVKLGFQPLEDGHPRAFLSAVLDFGPGSVDAWLRRLVRSSLGIVDEDHLDRDRHGLVLGGELLPLTPRELAVVEVLLEDPGRVVDRDTLLERAWDGGLAVGSNVVDVLVRGLRKKLGPRAERLETVRGVGYRWRP